MDASVVKKVKKVMRTLDMGLPPAETHRAIYDMAVHDLGVERVGSFDVYQQKPPGYWTLEQCQKVALKYLSKVEWQKSLDATAYKVASKNEWLDLCCSHMVEKQKPNGYWTLERCKEIALKYSSKSEWMFSIDSASFHAAYSKGWLNLCCLHMVEKRKPNGYWTLERCKEIALKYSSKSEWQQSEYGSYRNAYKNGWLDQCCSHMDEKQKPDGYWTIDLCKKIALTYSRKTEWLKSKDSASYIAAYSRGWLDQCCNHMQESRKEKGFWTLELCQADALKYSSKKKWSKSNDRFSYISALRNGWIDLCCKHMIPAQNPAGYWTLERCKSAALNYSSKTAWQYSSSSDKSGYDAARRNGWLEQCCTHMVNTRKSSGYWTLSRCKEVALIYSNRYQWFLSDHASAYAAAVKNGWLDLCCQHMIQKQKPAGYWTLERCQADAHKYSTKSEWGKSVDKSSYGAARRNGWLDQCCAHMIKKNSAKV